MNIDEYVFVNEEARRGLWNFISQHDSMVDRVKIKAAESDALPFLLANPKIQQETVPYFMARIVDVEQFLKGYPFIRNQERITVRVEDGFAEWRGYMRLIMESLKGEKREILSFTGISER